LWWKFFRDFLPLLGNGEEFGLKGITYRVQSEPRGIADALSLAEDWADNDNICVLLSDNIFEDNIKESIDKFESGAQVFLSRVAHPEHYGVAEITENDRIVSIVEKPKNPKSDWAVTGLYIYDNTVWNFIRTLEPSARGELEITDVNNYYLHEGKLQAYKLSGWWADCGENFDGYLDACNKVKSLENDGFPKDDENSIHQGIIDFTRVDGISYNYLYNYQYVQNERLENKCLNENKTTYNPISRRPPMCITGTIFRNDNIVQVFVINNSGVITFNNIEGNDIFIPEPDTIYALDGSINFNSGEITLYWNSNNPGETYLVVSYEYSV
jgi:glucose-1-phosphate thymidylyltransferase